MMQKIDTAEKELSMAENIQLLRKKVIKKIYSKKNFSHHLRSFFKEINLKGLPYPDDYHEQPREVRILKSIINLLYYAESIAAHTATDIDTLRYAKTIYNKATSAAELFISIDEEFQELLKVFDGEIDSINYIFSMVYSFLEQNENGIGELIEKFFKFLDDHNLSNPKDTGGVLGVAVNQLNPAIESTNFELIAEFSAELPKQLEKITQTIWEYSPIAKELQPSITQDQFNKLNIAAGELSKAIISVYQSSLIAMPTHLLNFIYIAKQLVTITTAIYEQISYMNESSQEAIRGYFTTLKMQLLPKLFGETDRIEDQFGLKIGRLGKLLRNYVLFYYDFLLNHAKSIVNFDAKGSELLVLEDEEFYSRRSQYTQYRLIELKSQLHMINITEQYADLFFDELLKCWPDPISDIEAPIKVQMKQWYQIFKDKLSPDAHNKISIELEFVEPHEGSAKINEVAQKPSQEEVPSQKSLLKSLRDGLTSLISGESNVTETVTNYLTNKKELTFLEIREKMKQKFQGDRATCELHITLNKEILNSFPLKSEILSIPVDELAVLSNGGLRNKSYGFEISREGECYINDPQTLTKEDAYHLAEFYKEKFEESTASLNSNEYKEKFLFYSELGLKKWQITLPIYLMPIDTKRILISHDRYQKEVTDLRGRLLTVIDLFSDVISPQLEINGEVPYPELEQANAALRENRIVIAFKAFYKALYHLDEAIKLAQSLNINSWNPLEAFKIVNLKNHAVKLGSLCKIIYDDSYIFEVVKSLIRISFSMKDRVLQSTDPYLKKPGENEFIPAYTALWLSVQAFLLIPEKIKSANEQIVISDDDQEKIKNNAIRLVKLIERILGKADSKFLLFTETSSVFNLLKELRDRLIHFSAVSYHFITNNLQEIYLVLNNLVLEIKKLETRLGLKPGLLSAFPEKIIEDCWEGFLEKLDINPNQRLQILTKPFRYRKNAIDSAFFEAVDVELKELDSDYYKLDELENLIVKSMELDYPIDELKEASEKMGLKINLTFSVLSADLKIVRKRKQNIFLQQLRKQYENSLSVETIEEILNAVYQYLNDLKIEAVKPDRKNYIDQLLGHLENFGLIHFSDDFINNNKINSEELKYVFEKIIAYFNGLLLTKSSEESLIQEQCEFLALKRDKKTNQLFDAIKQNLTVEEIKYLLDLGYEPNRTIDFETGYTCLHYAVITYNVELVNLLIEYGANLNSRDKNGNTPVLLLNSIDYFKDEQGVNYSIFQNLVELIKLNKIKNKTILQDIVEKRHFNSIVSLLDESDLKINCLFENNENVLHLAVRASNLSIIEMLLLRQDIDVNAKNKMGLSPLDLAIELNMFNVVERLLFDPLIKPSITDNYTRFTFTIKTTHLQKIEIQRYAALVKLRNFGVQNNYISLRSGDSLDFCLGLVRTYCLAEGTIFKTHYLSQAQLMYSLLETENLYEINNQIVSDFNHLPPNEIDAYYGLCKWIMLRVQKLISKQEDILNTLTSSKIDEFEIKKSTLSVSISTSRSKNKIEFFSSHESDSEEVKFYSFNSDDELSDEFMSFPTSSSSSSCGS